MIIKFLYSLILKRVLLFLLSFYLLYVFFDLSLHSSEMHQHTSTSLKDLTIYYFYNLIKRLDLLLPLSILLTTIYTITSLNQNRELLALQISGRSLHSIVKPFIISGLAACLIIGSNSQFLLPKAQAYIDHFDKTHSFKIENKSHSKIHLLQLNNGGKLLFAKEDKVKKVLTDAYFIASPSEVWHFKTLEELKDGKIRGKYVDTLVKDKSMTFIKKESFEEMDVPFLSSPLSKSCEDERQPFENFSISDLMSNILRSQVASSSNSSQISAQLYYKLVMPWFSLLLTLAIIPFCTQFSRSNKNLLLYTGGLMGFAIFFTIMDASVILAENNIISPLIAVFAPMAISLTIFGAYFSKLR